MRAVIWTEYGASGGLHLVDLPKPIPKAGELLIRIRATSVTAGDAELRALRFGIGMRLLVRLIMGVTRPRRQVLGQEFSGDVEAVGAGTVHFRTGTPVFGTTGFRFGAYADYLCVREDRRDAALALKPGNVSYEEAAAIPTGALEALHYLRPVGSLRGKSVLVIGAGGGIGGLAVQLAKGLGAEVTGVDSTRKLPLVRQLGADHVIDFTQEDFTLGSKTYDVIFDVVGRSRFTPSLRVLRAGGYYLIGNPRVSAKFRAPWGWARNGKKVLAHGRSPSREELDYLRGLVETGMLLAPIDSTYPLEEIAAAHERVDSGENIGRVVISVQPR